MESLAFNLTFTSKLNVDYVEDIWISFKIKQKSYVVGVVYRHPIFTAIHMRILTEKLQNLFLEIKSTKTEFYALGDFNVDLLQLKTNKTICMYAENFLASSMKCLIDKPTTIAETSKALIESSLLSEICINDISDHFPILGAPSSHRSDSIVLGPVCKVCFSAVLFLFLFFVISSHLIAA